MTPSPSATLAVIGVPREYTARVGFARNALAAGGIDAVLEDAPADLSKQRSARVNLWVRDAGYAGQGAHDRPKP